MDTVSLWKHTAKKTHAYPTLKENIEVDVAIIGGGITGVTTALHLLEHGKTVAILEAYTLGSGTTAYSTGNLYVPVQPYYQNVIAKFNLDAAKVVAQSRAFGIDFIEKIVREKKIQCHFQRRPWFLYTSDKNQFSFFDKEVEAFKKMDLEMTAVDSLPLPLKTKRAVELKNQARFNPYQYVLSVGDDLANRGCKIFENTRVLSYEEKKDRCHLQTEHGKVVAKKMVIATHTPAGINLTQLFTAPYRSYVVAVQTQDHDYPEGHFWDLNKPHHAVCTHPINGEKPALLMVAGSHHKTGQTKNAESHYTDLTNYLRDHFKVEKIAFQWSAQHYQSADDVPYIGLNHKSSKHTYLATGYFADGLLYGTIAGLIIGDAILGKKNPWADVYRSTRFKPLASAAFLAKENTNVFAQYLKDYPILNSKKIADIKKNEAKVVEINREKCAVYRDELNQVHAVSAVCTHMKCIVNWNSAEKTWDCPCHGSRFDIHGKVIEGPAIQPLATKNIKEK